MQIKNAKTIQKKSRSHKVSQVSLDHFTVESGASGSTYDVTFASFGPCCTCKWGEHRKASEPSACSHTVSVLNFIAEQEGRKVMVWTDPASASRQHRPTVNVGNGVILTTRKAAPAPIVWVIEPASIREEVEV